MAHQFSMLGIMNAALLAQGQEEILSENDGSDEWRMLFRNWPGIVEAELEDGMYHFTRRETELLTRTDGKYGFDDAFLVPSEALHVRDLWITNAIGTRCKTDWIQDDLYVYLDNPDGCFIEYAISNEVDLWSANFTRGVQLSCEALILRGIKEEYAEADQFDAMAKDSFQRARTISSKSRSPKTMYVKGPIALSRRRRRG